MEHHTHANSPFGNASCMEMLQLVLDGQATDEQVLYWRQHMGMCQPCYEKYNIDNAIKEAIQSECCCSKIPKETIDQLRERIKNIA